jgi:hydrogenase nickel incorporation protein HypA/HybF
MHEMSIVMSIVETASEHAARNGAAGVRQVVVQVGGISGVVPRYLMEFYPVVAEGTVLEGSELVIETVAASVFCTKCATTYDPCETDMVCPKCGGEDCDVIEGRGLLVKEILIEMPSPAGKAGET